MRALSIIGIILSVIGIVFSIYIMTEAKSHCYCNDDYLYSGGSVPDEAIGGGFVTLLIFTFFLVFSIIGVAKSGSTNPVIAQTIPAFPQNPFPNLQQPFPPQYNQQFPPNPYYQNPYPQNPNQPPPYQNPNQNPTQNPPTAPNIPPTNPWAPK
ncbi:hypothetical protein BH09BAC5_BH09BAC5_17190 [soil metagenome]